MDTITPKFSGLFPELVGIYQMALEQGGIEPGHAAVIAQASQAIADALDRAAQISQLVTDSAITKFAVNLVNVTITDLQKELDRVKRELRRTSALLNESQTSLNAMVPVRVVVAQDGQDMTLIEIEDEDGKGLRVRRHGHAVNHHGNYEAFHLYASRGQIEGAA